MGKRSNRSDTKSEAEFIGWQEGPVGTRFALFNITADGHPFYGSTVCETTLREFNLQVPRILLREHEAIESVPQKNEREMRKK